jgi:tetratricopeptide (TPR) repeat protein
VPNQFKQSNAGDANSLPGAHSTWTLAHSSPNFDPRKASSKFEQSETGKIETLKPSDKDSKGPKSPQQKKIEADAEKKAKDPFERLKEKYKKAQAAAEATWGVIAGEEPKFPVTPKRRKSDDAKASMSGMAPAQPNIETAAPAQALLPATTGATSEETEAAAFIPIPPTEEIPGATFVAEPEREPSVDEGVEVGSWAERVLSRQKGDTNEIAADSEQKIKPEPIRSRQEPKPEARDTRSDAAQAPDKEESWAERVIAAARKAKGTNSVDAQKASKATPPATPKIDVDQSSSMRLKFHGNAPQPALPNRLQKGSASFWSTHREKVNLACIVVGVILTGVLLGRAFMSGLYAHRAEELMINKKYDTAMRYIDTALFFDPTLETAHYLKARALSRLGQDSGALAEYNIVLSTSPSRIDALERRAAACVAIGNFRQALDDCNKLLEMRSKPPTMYVFANRGIANYMLGNKNAAAKDFTTALQMKPKDVQLLTRRGASYRDVGETKQALEDYDAAIKINANSVEAYLGRAQSWLQAKNYDKAFADFDQALALSPKNPEILTLRGAAHTTAKEYDKAADDFARALAINPRFADAFRERARLNIMQDQLWQAEEDLGHAAQLKPPDSAFYKQRAELDRNMGHHDKAVEDYNQSLVQQPYDIDSYIGRAHDYSDLGNQSAALADIDAALKLDPNYAELYALRGLYGNRYGNTSTAKNDFDKAMWLDPLNADAHLWRGEYLLKQRDFMAAIEDFDKALKSNPELTEAKQKKAAAQAALKQGGGHSTPTVVAPLTLTPEENNLIAKGTFEDLVKEGNAQLSSGNPDRAVALLERAVRINSTDAPARRSLARALQAAGNTNDAISQLGSVLRLDQTNAGDARALGDALIKAHRMPEAIEAYKRCLQLYPNDIPATCALARAYAATGFPDKAKTVCQEGLKNAGNAPADISQINAVLKEIESKPVRH